MPARDVRLEEMYPYIDACEIPARERYVYLVDISTLGVILVGMIRRRYASHRHAFLAGIYPNCVPRPISCPNCLPLIHPGTEEQHRLVEFSAGRASPFGDIRR